MMLYVVLSLLRDRGFREDAIVGAVFLGALARIARENQARTRARLIAWWNEELIPADRAPADDRAGIDRAA